MNKTEARSEKRLDPVGTEQENIFSSSMDLKELRKIVGEEEDCENL